MRHAGEENPKTPTRGIDVALNRRPRSNATSRVSAKMRASHLREALAARDFFEAPRRKENSIDYEMVRRDPLLHTL